jgi:cell division protein FtsB
MPAKVKRVDFSRRGKWLSVLFIAFLLYFAVILINQQLTLRNLTQRRDELNNEIAHTESLNNQLKTQVELLQTDMDYIEGVARRELGLVREGETVYILPRWNAGQ